MLQGLDAPLPGAEEVYPLREEGGVTTNDEKGSLDDKASLDTNEAHADKASFDDNVFGRSG